MRIDELPDNLRFDLIQPTSRVVVATYKDHFSVNAAAIALSNFIVVVDTLCYPEQGEAFRERVESEFGIPVKHLFITHCHGDHVFGMAPFKDVEVFGSQALVENMKTRMEERWTEEAFSKWREEEPELADSIDKIEVWLPEIGFKDRHTIIDETLTVEFYNSGGHTSCSSYAYFPSERVLVTGDDLAAFNWPYIFDSTGNPDKWITAFEEMLKLDPGEVVPGHGPIVGKEHILEHLKYLESLKELVKRVIAEGKSPADIQAPEFYEPAEEWQVQEAMKHLYSYYSEM